MRPARAAVVRRAGGGTAWLAYAAVFAVAAAVAAGGGVFAAAVGDRLAADQAALLDDRGPAIVLRAEAVTGPGLLEGVAAMRAEVADLPGTRDAVATLAIGGGQTTAAGPEGALAARVRIVARAGAIAALDITAGSGEGGVLVSERAAAALGVGPGGELQIRDPQWGVQEDVVEGVVATLPVAGVYADLDVSDLGPFWRRLPGELQPRELTVFGGIVEPELLVAAPELLASLGAGQAPVRLWWEEAEFAGLAGRGELVRLDTALRALERRADDPATDLGAALAAARVGRVEARAGAAESRAAVAAAVRELEAAVRPVEVGAVVLGLAVVAVGAWFAAGSRRDELRMWSVAGRSPGRLAVSGAAGAALPAIVGTAAGAAAAPFLVRIGSPSSRLHAGAVPVSWVAVVLIAGLAVVGAAFGLAAVRTLRPARPRLWWAADLAVYATGAVVVAQVLRTDPDRADPTALGPAAALLPLAGVAAVVLALARLAGWAAHRLRRSGSGAGAVGFLAWRRLAAALGGRAAMIVVVGTAAGVVVLTSALIAATDRALAAKATIVVGSDSAARAPTRALPATLPAGTALVRTGTISLAGEGRVSLLILDAGTYPAAVRWHPEFELTATGLLGRLEPAGEQVPAVAVGPGRDRLAGTGVLRLQLLTLPYRVVDRVEAVPGMSTVADATLVVRSDVVEEWIVANPAASGLARLTAGGDGEDEAVARMLRAFTGRLLAAGGPDVLVTLLEQVGLGEAPVATRAGVLAGPDFVTRRWAFDYMRRVAIGALVAAAAVFAFSQVEARRRRVVARALTARMGLGRGTEAAATAIEIGAVAGLALLFGAVAGLGLGVLVAGRLDPLPGIPPGVEPGWPLAALGWPAAVGALGALAAWLAATRATAAADVAEVLRSE